MSSSSVKPESPTDAANIVSRRCFPQWLPLLGGRSLPENIRRIAGEAGVWLAGLGLLVLVDEIGALGQLTTAAFVMAIYFTLVAITGNFRTSMAAAALLVLLIAATSWAKVHYMGVALVLDDLFYLTGHSLWSTITQYKSLVWLAGAGVLAVVFAIVMMVVKNRFRLSLVWRLAALILGLNIATQLPGLSTTAYMRDPVNLPTCCAISSFANSVVNRLTHGGGHVTFSQVAAEGLSGIRNAAVSQPAAAAKKPDIFMVLDESAFDPRDLGLPVQSGIDDYFAPQNGQSGTLNVVVHGGGTWVTEFSAMTGLDTRNFGDKAYFLPVLMAGRVKQSLMTHLKSQGYETIVVYPVKGAFMNAENNYRALGADEFIGWSADQHPGSVWMTQDRQLYERALARAEQIKRSSGKPVFVAIITIHNHGPHTESTASPRPGQGVDAWLAKNAPGDELAPYREFYRRLSRNMDDYGWLKHEYARRFPESSLVLGHYGDHQPKFTKDLAVSAGQREAKLTHVTRFAIEGINQDLVTVPDWGDGRLDIAYLPGVLLSAAGLPLDVFFKARLELMQRCKGLYFSCDDPLKGRIHRSLIDRGLLDVDRTLPVEAARTSSAEQPETKTRLARK